MTNRWHIVSNSGEHKANIVPLDTLVQSYEKEYSLSMLKWSNDDLFIDCMNRSPLYLVNTESGMEFSTKEYLQIYCRYDPYILIEPSIKTTNISVSKKLIVGCMNSDLMDNTVYFSDRMNYYLEKIPEGA